SAHVQSSADILVFVMSGSDSYPVIPVHSLGMKHMLHTVNVTLHDTEAQGKFLLNFASVAIPYKDTTVTVTQMIKGEKQIGKLGAYNRLTLTSKSSLTGMRITADKPVSVVSGANTEKLMYIEQMTPTETWGKIYLFPIKRASPETDTSSTPTVDVKIVVKHGKKETANKSLRITSHQGVSHNLKSAQGLVAVVGSSPIHVLFALQSKSMMRKSKSKALQEGFHMWLALAPVEQYFPDPCLLAQQCNVIVRKTLLVGLKASTYENVKKNGNLTTGTTRLELDPFWVLMVPNFMFKEINKDKDLIGPNMTSPLWYYNVHVIQRDMRF
ncbi:hypothetical protein BaRGS_00002677, partial [Batillaria attramentaria]